MFENPDVSGLLSVHQWTTVPSSSTDEGTVVPKRLDFQTF